MSARPRRGHLEHQRVKPSPGNAGGHTGRADGVPGGLFAGKNNAWALFFSRRNKHDLLWLFPQKLMPGRFSKNAWGQLQGLNDRGCGQAAVTCCMIRVCGCIMSPNAQVMSRNVQDNCKICLGEHGISASSLVTVPSIRKKEESPNPKLIFGSRSQAQGHPIVLRGGNTRAGGKKNLIMREAKKPEIP